MPSISGVKLGHGFTVRIGVGASPTFTTVAGWEDITFPDRARPDVDVTHNGSPDSTEEHIPGLFPAVDWQATMLYVQGSDEDELFDGLHISGDELILEITPPGGTARQWKGYVKNYVPGLPVKGAMKAVVTLHLNGRVVSGGGS